MLTEATSFSWEMATSQELSYIICAKCLGRQIMPWQLLCETNLSQHGARDLMCGRLSRLAHLLCAKCLGRHSAL